MSDVDNIERCLRHIDPIDSLYFDVSVSWHMLTEDREDIASKWLGPHAAMHELDRSRSKGFLTEEEYWSIRGKLTRVWRDIEDNKLTDSSFKDLDDVREVAARKVYPAFCECLSKGKE